MKSKQQKAFTLTELLVVIAIIGLISTLTIVFLQSNRAKSRDVKRVSDIKQIQTALEMYHADNKQYPEALNDSIFLNSKVYLAKVPSAPTPPDGDCSPTDNNYIYETQGSRRTSYTINFCLGSKTGQLEAGVKIATTRDIGDPPPPPPPPPPFVCDDNIIDTRDQNVYPTVKIGNQCWMAKNLAYLPAVFGSSVGSETDPKYYVYGYNGTDVATAKATANYTTYGVLYNHPAAIQEGICPSGWHVPTDGEWTVLISYLSTSTNSQYWCGGNSNNIAKSLAATSTWLTNGTACTVGNDIGSNNSTGFNALPAGYRNNGGGFYVLSSHAYWCSSSPPGGGAWGRSLRYDEAEVGRGGYRSDGYSLRCLQD